MELSINKRAYEKLIKEDLDFLNKHLNHVEDSLELNHIKVIICSSIDYYYPSGKANTRLIATSRDLLFELQNLVKICKANDIGCDSAESAIDELLNHLIEKEK